MTQPFKKWLDKHLGNWKLLKRFFWGNFDSKCIYGDFRAICKKKKWSSFQQRSVLSRLDWPRPWNNSQTSAENTAVQYAKQSWNAGVSRGLRHIPSHPWKHIFHVSDAEGFLSMTAISLDWSRGLSTQGYRGTLKTGCVLYKNLRSINNFWNSVIVIELTVRCCADYCPNKSQLCRAQIKIE